MTTKPEVLAYFISHKHKHGSKWVGVSLHGNRDPSCVNDNWNYDPLVRLSDYEALQAECERLRGLLRDTASVAITMLYDSHKADVLAEFKVPELEAVVDASKHLQSHRVEHVYRRAWDAAIDAAIAAHRKGGES